MSDILGILMADTPPKRIADIPTEITHHKTTHIQRLVTAAESHTGNIATMNYAWLEPNKQLTVHTHPDGEEFYIFLDGKGEILIGETWFPVDSGYFATIPAKYDHSVKNTGTKNLTFITVRTVRPIIESDP